MLSLVYKRLDAEESLRQAVNRLTMSPDRIYQLVLDATGDEEQAAQTKAQLALELQKSESKTKHPFE